MFIGECFQVSARFANIFNKAVFVNRVFTKYVFKYVCMVFFALPHVSLKKV